MDTKLTELQQLLQYHFNDNNLLLLALTHRSHAVDHYERLEFLGDAVLNLAISKLLYIKLSGLPEGDLSRIRANLVKQDTLFKIAKDLDLSRYLKLGEGEKKTGGGKRPSILADVLEAILGAVYLDGGFDAANDLIGRLFHNVEISPNMEAIGKDPKTLLQEWLQARHYPLPLYTIVYILGQAHEQSFDVQCEILQLQLAERGLGGSRRAAEQTAASAILEKIKQLAIP